MPAPELARMMFCMMNGFLVERMLHADLSEEFYGSMLGTFLIGVYARASIPQPPTGAEIERKFLIDRVPSDAPEGDPIEQGYVPLESEESELRLRRRVAAFTVTVKRGTGLEREEHEFGILPAMFAIVWPLTEGARIEKERARIPHGELTIELDRYRGDLEGLVVAEVEFPNSEDADAFEPPDWFGREVTGEPAYSNRELAVHGAPESGVPT
jgi:CYTH domain-containing protein